MRLSRLPVVATAGAIVLLLALVPFVRTSPPTPQADLFKSARALAINADGKTFILTAGAAGQADGAILNVVGDKAVPFASGFKSPRALAAFKGSLIVAERDKILQVDAKGKASVIADTAAFPMPPVQFTCIAVDWENGSTYVCDQGDASTGGPVIYKVSRGGFKQKMSTTAVIDAKRWPGLVKPAAILTDGASYLLVLDSASGKLFRLRLSDGAAETVASGLGSDGSMAWDHWGRLYISDGKSGKLFVLPRPGQALVPIPIKVQSATNLALDGPNRSIVILDAVAGATARVPTQVPGAPVDETPLDIEAVVAFPNLKWTGWNNETETGKANPLRPIQLTHAGDGSNRNFVATQHGVIHVFPNDQKATKTSVFLDIHERVTYSDKTNEEGFLGLAFHPKYKTNGEFFVFYTIKTPKLTNVISRFKVSKDDPNKADPNSEEEIFRITRPYWNHDGGTLVFGPDGYLYFALGDGGLGGDPHNNGQNLDSYLAKVLRIDVDSRSEGKKYGIPKDNPFVGKPNAKPETWAYGLRNIWRMAFDPKTGQLWAADVGQNLFEEIDIIVKGGNYGWRLREGLHPFQPGAFEARGDLIDPIWEYHHEVGNSITGGGIYRGKRLPELDGAYLYGDYVRSKIWALRYDEAKKRVVANQPIAGPGLPLFSFGEDEQGEMYFLTSTLSGRGIYGFARKGGKLAPN
jgi:glucose/arabinose dehydrogenase